MATAFDSGGGLELPAMIAVQLRCEGPDDLAQILVAIDFRANGHYYYGALVGLTDNAGLVRIDRDAIERQFAKNQQTFPMDYRVPLADCDGTAVVRADGGREFTRQRPAKTEPLVDPDTIAMWGMARNSRFRSTQATLSLDRVNPDGVARVDLPLRRRRGWLR